MYQRVMRSPFNRSENRQVMKCSEPIRASSKTLESSPTAEGFDGGIRLLLLLLLCRGALRPLRREPFPTEVVGLVIHAFASVGDPSREIRVLAYRLAGC